MANGEFIETQKIHHANPCNNCSEQVRALICTGADEQASVRRAYNSEPEERVAAHGEAPIVACPHKCASSFVLHISELAADSPLVRPSAYARFYGGVDDASCNVAAWATCTATLTCRRWNNLSQLHALPLAGSHRSSPAQAAPNPVHAMVYGYRQAAAAPMSALSQHCRPPATYLFICQYRCLVPSFAVFPSAANVGDRHVQPQEQSANS